MTAVGWLPADAEELFGTGATAEESYGVLTVDVPPASWIPALETARDRIGCTFFDWLSAVDEPGTGLHVTAHVAALSPVRRLLLRTTVPHEAPVLPSAVDVYAGAAWHERETYEMFGIDFTGHPALEHLLLPDGFEGRPLRKDFVLAARVAKAWPGAKEPGEPEHGGPRRRQMLPPGVPDPNEWGPLKGQLPPAPARAARGAGRAAAGAAGAAGERPAAARPAGDRPVRRTRTAAQGSASQVAGGAAGADTGAAAEPTRPSGPAAPPARRARSASEGSASQRAAARGAGGPRRARSASEGSASQRAAADRAASPGGTGPADGAPAPGPAGGGPERKPSGAPRSPDAPWHHARPAFDRPGTEDGTGAGAGAGPGTGTAFEAERETGAPDAPRDTAPGTAGGPGTPAPGPEQAPKGRDVPRSPSDDSPGDGGPSDDSPGDGGPSDAGSGDGGPGDGGPHDDSSDDDPSGGPR